MESFDILFPLNLPALTYSVPEELKGLIVPGQLIKAEIKNKVKIGLVLGRSNIPGVKLIRDICSKSPFISEPLLRLINWMSDYYFVNKGLVLKTMYSKEFFEVSSDGSLICKGPDRDERGEYRALLYHILTMEQEVSLLKDFVTGGSNIIILSPERTHVERIGERLEPLIGERLTLLHGDLSRKERLRAYSRIISGQSDIVLGTRIAIFAPLKKVSLIIVLREGDESYKNLQGVRFHGRDVAVMRAYIEKTKVVLSSAAPSLESYHNAKKGKYQFVRYGGVRRGPGVEIIDMNRAKKVSPYISKRVIDVAKDCLKAGGRLLFLINRKGYSLIKCRDCDYIERCKTCNMPLVYHKDLNQLQCHYCRNRFEIKDLCPSCGGATLETVGAGTQRIEAEIKRHLGINPLRLEKGMTQRFEEMREYRVIVSTGIIKQSVPERSFKACIFINPDIHLQFPDFRSGEHLFKELQGMRDWVEPEGFLMIQTRFPENHVYRAFKKRAIDEFYRIELSMRKSLLYPPFSHLANIEISYRDGDMKALEKRLSSLWIKELIYGSQFIRTDTEGLKWRLIFKASSKKRLHEGINELMSLIGNDRGVRIVVDIDPLSILC